MQVVLARARVTISSAHQFQGQPSLIVLRTILGTSSQLIGVLHRPQSPPGNFVLTGWQSSQQMIQAIELLAEAEARLSLLNPATEKLLPTAWMLLHSARMTVHNKRGETDAAEAAGLTADHYFHTLVTTEGHTLDTYKVELGDILLRGGKVAEAEAQWEELARRRTGMPELQDHAEARLRLAWLAAGRGEQAAVKLAAKAQTTFARLGNLERTRETERLIEQTVEADELPLFDALFKT